MIFGIEVLGMVVRHVILAVRLFANMFAGHLVLAVMMGFIAATAHSLLLWCGVMPVSVVGATALEFVGVDGGLLASLRFHVFVGIVYRHGGSPALSRTRHACNGQLL